MKWTDCNHVCLFFPSPTASMPMTVLNLGQMYPFQRGFFCKDNSIQYPYHDSTITTTMLVVVGLGLPMLSVSKLIVGRQWRVWCAGGGWCDGAGWGRAPAWSSPVLMCWMAAWEVRPLFNRGRLVQWKGAVTQHHWSHRGELRSGYFRMEGCT